MAVGQYGGRAVARYICASVRWCVCTALFAALPPYSLSAQVDPTGHWITLETAHFDVHTRAEYRDVALRAAGEAEEAWTAYAAIIAPPRSRIDLVVADNADEANGYATTYPRPRIVIYLMPPAGDLELEAYDRWLRLVVTHELAHIFHLDLARGWWGVARMILGRAPFLFPNLYTPPWMREGLAVFYESRLTNGGRLGGAWFSAVVNAAAAEDRAMPLDQASTASPRWPAGHAAYAFGSRFMDEAAARFGDSVVAGYATGLAVKPIPYLQLGAAWRKAAGEGLAEIWDSAQARRPVAPTDGRTDRPIEIVGGLRTVVAPRVSPDGSRILLALDNGRDAMRLVEIRRDSGTIRRVARLNAASGIAWTAEGGALVSQLEFTDLYTMRDDLWSIGPAGDERRVTHGQRLREPDVASDGAVVAVRVAAGRTELSWRVGESERWQVLAAAGPGVDWASPRFSPTGRLIAAVRVEQGWHDIVLLDRTGAIVRTLTRDSVADLAPAFTPDGQWLVWSREIDGVPQIVGVQFSADGQVTGSAQFTDEPFAAYAPGPANDTLYYFSYHAAGFGLARVPLAAMPWTLPDLPGSVAPGLPSPGTVIRAEHPYRSLRSALPHYWLPQFYSEPGGSWIGAFSSGSDALERHAWAASLMAGLGSVGGQWHGQIAWLQAGPGHALVDASASHTPQLATSGCCDPDDAVHAGLSLVRRRWRSQSLVRFGAEYAREFGAERAGGSLNVQWSRAITPALSVGTQSGTRVGATLRYRHRLHESLESTEFTVRVNAFGSDSARRFARRVFGVHAAYGTIGGNDPVEYSMGGVSAGAIGVLPGISLGGGARTFPIRGLAPGTLSGRRALGSSLELREPLSLLGRGLGLFPLGLDWISATLFTDVGVIWSPQYCGTSTSPAPGGPGAPMCRAWAASVGPELSSNVVLGFDVPLRFRVGTALAGTKTGGDFSGGLAAFVAVGSSF